jgi:hypothetical protein
LQHSPSQIYIRGFHPVTRHTNIILESGLWVDSAYKLEHTYKELDGRLTSLLLLARFFSSAFCFVIVCTFQTFSSTPSLALLFLPLDAFALTHFHTPLPHMPPWYSYKTKPCLPPPCLYFACGLIKYVGGASRDVSWFMYG